MIHISRHVGLLLLAALLLSGCSTGSSKSRSALDLFDQAHITYVVPAKKLKMSNDMASGETNWRGLWTDSEQSESSYVCCLQLLYPHPERGEKYAQAVLINQPTVASAGGDWRPASNGVAWVRDIRKRDLDRALTELRSKDFFNHRGRTKSDIHVTVNVDGHVDSRDWLQNDVLDEMIWYARGHGESTAMTAVPQFARRAPAGSVLAYQDALKRETAPPAKPVQAQPVSAPAAGAGVKHHLVKRLPPLPPVRTAWR